jgi:two-component system LytT family response regulator
MQSPLPGAPVAGPSRIVVRDSGRIHVIKVRDIEWISACGNYVEIHAGETRCLHRGGLRELLERLSTDQFVRLQRSLAVHRDKVCQVETVGKGRYLLHMRSGASLPTQLPVGEIRRALLLEAA